MGGLKRARAAPEKPPEQEKGGKESHDVVECIPADPKVLGEAVRKGSEVVDVAGEEVVHRGISHQSRPSRESKPANVTGTLQKKIPTPLDRATRDSLATHAGRLRALGMDRAFVSDC